MNDFYALRNVRLDKDFNLLKRLEIKHKQLEDKISSSKKAEARPKFRAHPKRILSDSDTTASNTPRVPYNLSSSTSKLNYGESEYEERKQKAQTIHKKLHEKLSIIERNPCRKSDFGEIGDRCPTSKEDIGDRYQNRPNHLLDETSSEGSLMDLEMEERCGKMHERKRAENNYSAASRATSGVDRKSAGSKLSTQSLCPRGIPLSVFERKFKIFVEKSLHFVAEIRSILAKGITPPDGEEDESRRIVRNKEFSNRFSRNYLYPLARQIKELSLAQQMNPLLVNQKLLSIYQIVNNGLQAYQNYLPSSVGDCTFNQLKILMSNVVELCEIHREHIKNEEESYIMEFVDTFKINAELTIQKVEEYLAKPPPSTDSILKSDKSKISLSKYGEGRSKTGFRRGSKRGNADKRFSMYTVTASFRKDAPWKRAVENLAKNKFNVKSKYKTATYKHRPPLEREPEIGSIPKLKTLFPKKSGILRPTRLNTPINEDSIKTMVEEDQNENNHLEKEEWENMEKKTDDNRESCQSNKEEILMKLLQFALKNHQEGAKDDQKTQINEILSLVEKEPNPDFLNKVLDGLAVNVAGDSNKENQDSQQLLTLEIVKSQHSLINSPGSSREKLRRKEPKITISGEKNARLICITDENSLIEPPPENEAPDKPCQVEELENPKIVDKASSETQTDIKFGDNNKVLTKSTQKGRNSSFVKISRLKKCGRNLKPLDKNMAVDAIQYKLDFYRHCKNNPMYKRSTACQPWILMGKISEELLNECLLAVAREIEVNDIVERVYRSELQL